MKDAFVVQRLSFLFVFSLALVCNPMMAAAADIQCYDCHGTRSPIDYRPLDAPNRDDATGGVQGNHRSHLGPTLNAAACDKCHPASSDYTSDHRNGTIRLSSNINSSPLNAMYKNMTSFPQTPTPSLGSCTNVNCHFEKTTPGWGGPNLSYPSDCNGICHSSPPAGGSGGADGSHTSHNYYFPGLTNCAVCHADHTSEPSPFGHASSVSNRGINFNRANPFFGAYGRYSGNTRDYLPSQANSFGKCSTVYCHSSVQGLTDPTQPPVTLYAPTWGESFTDYICGGTKGCHGVGFAHADDASDPAKQARWKTLASGSHGKHLKYQFNEIGNCQACHYNFTGNGTGCLGCHMVHSSFLNHLENSIEVNFDPSNTLFTEGTGAYSGDTVPGTPYGSCSGLYCHSSGTAVSTGVLTANSPLQWGSGSLACNGCHGYPPAYANGSPKANSHQAHNGYDCSKCHYNVTTDGSTIITSHYHVNRAYDVNAGTGVSFTYSYAAAGGTCNNISCHHSGNAQWGTILACDACHDAPPATAAHQIHYGGTVAQAGYGDLRTAQDFSTNATNYIMNCGNCHPMDAAKHGNGIVEVELYNAQAPAGTLKALNPSSAVYVNGTTVHTDSKGFAFTYGTCGNIYCHSYSDWTTPGGVPLQSDCLPSSSSYWPANLVITRNYKTVSWGGSHLDCAGCHANPPKTAYPANDGGAGNSHAWLNNYGEEDLHGFNHGFRAITCNYCHNGTVTQANGWTRDAMGLTTFSDVPIANYSKHVNGTNNVAFESAFIYYSTGSSSVRRTMNLTTAAYDTGTKTCSNVSCHFEQTTVKWGTPYRYFDYSYECDRCHKYGYANCP